MGKGRGWGGRELKEGGRGVEGGEKEEERQGKGEYVTRHSNAG